MCTEFSSSIVESVQPKLVNPPPLPKVEGQSSAWCLQLTCETPKTSHDDQTNIHLELAGDMGDMVSEGKYHDSNLYGGGEGPGELGAKEISVHWC